MARVLVTGASGFLGSRVAHGLANAGALVRTTGRSLCPSTPLPGYRAADLLDSDSVPRLVEGITCIVHCAGLAHQFQPLSATQADFTETNAVATERLARCAAAAGVRHFVLVSSVSVYGRRAAGPTDEMAACQPRGPYAESKYAGEERLMQVVAQTGMTATVLRLATLYGEGDRGNVDRLMKAIDRGRFVWIGPGQNRKSLLHVDDAARACVLAAMTQQRSADVEIYNVCGRADSMVDIVNGLASALGRQFPRFHVPVAVARLPLSALAWLPPVRRRALGWRDTLDKWTSDEVFSGERFQQTFAFLPQTTLNNGLQSQVAAYRGISRDRPIHQAA